MSKRRPAATTGSGGNCLMLGAIAIAVLLLLIGGLAHIHGAISR
ncbi:hypothetical protein WG901_02880 [Novosphingobium sp. PS1R-30]|uniref:Uncharacterized protein n=1 Tax=Novosphingobium anseongense TaxID=3133436 RepID=A0ABU8RR44_9SPHN